ncbi:ABC transporter permease [Qipengyuania vesicularis]|uniref:ABC transporter permease n=1 Tax=Qipengyuania vesicularis TaxID=2867232 RepID=UPI001C8683CF|nr:ABC transporter permease [Qipengyuania vesicularis]MBX7528131.1 ABC transporter permease [Qipengyuania vesicularis]
MSHEHEASRLSFFEAAWVVARRDFKAILFSRAFFFFLLGPLFPIVVGALAGGIGGQVQREAVVNTVALAMSDEDNAALVAAGEAAKDTIGGLPRVAVIDSEERESEGLTPESLLDTSEFAVVVTGSLVSPVITGTPAQISRWDGPVALLSAMASGTAPSAFPEITERPLATTAAAAKSDRIRTAQAGQLLLFLLMMLLAGMVLSNLVEEKANKVIEVLAAAIPMDSVFFGKLFAMLGVSFVGIAVWALFGGAIGALAGSAMPSLPEPALGWPLFVLLGITYFAMGYLLLGSLFLTIGGMATTVREVQTLSMPVTMAQLLVFFLAAFAMTNPGSPLELFAAIFPLSSPFAMLARAAQSPDLLPHLLALAWQVLCVAIFIKAGATLFRRRVMKSGKGGRGTKGRIAGTLPGGSA